MGVHIRPVRTDDAAAVSDLLRQLGYPRTGAEVADGLSRPDAPDGFVAEADGRVVGFVALRVHFELHRAATVASIDALVVDEGHRGRSIGERLVEAAATRARSRGADVLDLHSNARRTDARRFYERLGFTGDGIYLHRTVDGDG